MDGHNTHDKPKYPSHLMYFVYKKLSWAGYSLSIGQTNSLMMQPNILFEVDQWYKFTISGKPIRSDGEVMFYDWENRYEKPVKCRQEYSIEGPGLVGNNGIWKHTYDSACLEMQEGYPLKVFGAKEVISQPMDGVLRNIVFENTATGISIDSTC